MRCGDRHLTLWAGGLLVIDVGEYRAHHGSDVQITADPDVPVLFRSLATEDGISVDDHATRLDWPPDRARLALGRLAELRLVTIDADSGRIEVVSPDVAAAAYLDAEESAFRERLAHLARAKVEIMSLAPVYDAVRRLPAAAQAFEEIDDVAAVRALLGRAAQSVKRRVSICHPGGGMDAAGIDRSLVLDEQMLARGVALYSLLTHSTRNRVSTRRYVERVSRLGGEVRTSWSVPPKTIIFDESTAFLPATTGPGAVVVHHPGVVRYLRQSFDVAFSDAQPYSLGGEPGAGGFSEIEVALLRQLATGRKDEQIARNLGVSLRTCRRHIANVMSELGVASRFQAGAVAARRALIEVDP